MNRFHTATLHNQNNQPGLIEKQSVSSVPPRFRAEQLQIRTPPMDSEGRASSRCFADAFSFGTLKPEVMMAIKRTQRK
jgi:hypothetical protein